MKRYLFFLFAAFALNSCVTTQVYDQLKADYDLLKSENQALLEQLNNRGNQSDRYSLQNLQQSYNQLKAERDRLALDYAAAQNNLKRLQDSYNALETNSSENLQSNLALNRDLLTQLDEKERALAAEQARLQQLQQALNARSKRVDELENVIAAKEAQMTALRETLTRALTNFEGKGLTVEQRDGKVYVSMENRLLFESGSWAVNANGRQAVVQLGQVLAQNPDIAVLIEGHTDNVPFRGSGNLNDNWDLSTKRATAIVNILTENPNINRENLTAAGRGEYAPIASNASADGRAKNRRIEVILTPKLDEINQLINQF